MREESGRGTAARRGSWSALGRGGDGIVPAPRPNQNDQPEARARVFASPRSRFGLVLHPYAVAAGAFVYSPGGRLARASSTSLSNMAGSWIAISDIDFRS